MSLIDYHKRQVEKLAEELSQESSAGARLGIECDILKNEKEIVRLESESRGFWVGALVGGGAGILIGVFLASTFQSWRY